MLIRLLTVLSLSHLRVERLKTALAFVGLVLGIALFIAIRLANESAWAGFADSVERIAPKTPLRIVGDGGGVPERIIPELLATPGVRTVSPLLIGYATLFADGDNLGFVQVVGVDPLTAEVRSRNETVGGRNSDRAPFDRESFGALLREKTGVFVSGGLRGYQRLELLLGAERIPLKSLGTLPEEGLGGSFGGRTVLFDIAHAQDLLRRWGELDAIDIVLDENVREGSTHGSGRIIEAEAVRRSIAARLPSGTRFAEPQENERYGRKMTEAFRLNLHFLASLSLLIALLLTYHAASYAVLKRRKEFGIILSLGGSLREIERLVAVEAALFGCAASVGGLVLGRVLAGYAIERVGGTINALYLPVRATEVILPIRVVLEGIVLGPLLTVLGSLLPLRELRSVSAHSTFGYQTYEDTFRVGIGKSALFGVAALGLAALSARPALLGYHPLLGLLSPAALVTGAVCFAPFGISCLIDVLRKLSNFLPAELVLALDHITQTLRRSSIAVTAMAVALAMYLSVSTLIVSFRGTVERWIEHVTKADVYISPLGNLGSSVGASIPPTLKGVLLNDPEFRPLIKEVDTLATRRVTIGDRVVRVNGARLDLAAQYQRLIMIEESKMSRVSGSGEITEVFLSEPAAERLHLQAGESFALPTLLGPRTVFIRGVYYDYSSDQGVILMSDRDFENLYQTDAKQGLSIYLAPGVTPTEIRERIERRFPDAMLTVRDNRGLRREVLRVFDETFLITYALQGIALLISGVTLLNTLLMLLLEREREFTVLRAIGASRRSLLRMVVSESLCLGGMALVGGIGLGALLAVQLVFVVNRFYFGWSIAFAVPWNIGAIAIIGTASVALAAAIWPGMRVVRTIDGGLLRYE